MFLCFTAAIFIREGALLFLQPPTLSQKRGNEVPSLLTSTTDREERTGLKCGWTRTSSRAGFCCGVGSSTCFVRLPGGSRGLPSKLLGEDITLLCKALIWRLANFPSDCHITQPGHQDTKAAGDNMYMSEPGGAPATPPHTTGLGGSDPALGSHACTSPSKQPQRCDQM